MKERIIIFTEEEYLNFVTLLVCAIGFLSFISKLNPLVKLVQEELSSILKIIVEEYE